MGGESSTSCVTDAVFRPVNLSSSALLVYPYSQVVFALIQMIINPVINTVTRYLTITLSSLSLPPVFSLFSLLPPLYLFFTHQPKKISPQSIKQITSLIAQPQWISLQLEQIPKFFPCPEALVFSVVSAFLSMFSLLFSL